MKNNLQGINSRIQNQISNLQYKKPKNTYSEQKKTESKKNEDSVRSLWDNFKSTNIHIIGVPEGEEEEEQIGKLFEKIMKENFPNLVKEIDMQVQEVQRLPNNMDAKRPTPRHIVIKIPKVKDKERLLKAQEKRI